MSRALTGTVTGHQLGSKFEDELFESEFHAVWCITVKDVAVHYADVHHEVEKWDPPLF